MIQVPTWYAWFSVGSLTLHAIACIVYLSINDYPRKRECTPARDVVLLVECIVLGFLWSTWWAA